MRLRVGVRGGAEGKREGGREGGVDAVLYCTPKLVEVREVRFRMVGAFRRVAVDMIRSCGNQEKMSG